ncbi:membrane protein insertion efficiency factor YidD [Nakamurella aerolata]|uniref:Putative membrane protein insertion efficiency factor n=1 Tax=Nakamurella aerolata TaxID=1656892 RepID=A0A849ACK5_9ACTN|nr:membrane protein insertion efficiency factor YidD [Nakamurella aerolata]NNG36888.1 membrane protein insertion efficiency factor YidD [Nakamurella aerolata]
MSAPARALAATVRFYQRHISPALPATCRYTPTCSAYAVQALTEHGALRGSWLSLRRLARCGPWSRREHVDLVPEPSPRRKAKLAAAESDRVASTRGRSATLIAAAAAGEPIAVAHSSSSGSDAASAAPANPPAAAPSPGRHTHRLQPHRSRPA